MMRLLVCGPRDWPGSWEDIGIHLPESHAVIIHGACSRKAKRNGEVCEVSVDMLADFAAHGLGHDVIRFPVDERIDGVWPGAGPARSARMLRDGKPTHGLALGPLWKRARVAGKRAGHGWKNTGTGDMVRRMLAVRLPVRWVPAPGADAVDLHKMPGPPAEG